MAGKAAMKIEELYKKCFKLNYQLAKWEKYDVFNQGKPKLFFALIWWAYKGSTAFVRDVPE
jgi:hypothetical protein